jgi:ribosome maturation protein Sdo1
MAKRFETLSDGTQYRDGKPFREGHRAHVRDITSTADVRAALRAGKHSTVGGYATAFYTSDGGTLCHDCVRKEYRQISAAIRHKLSDGWRVVNLDAECNTDAGATCDHCNAEIWAGFESDSD